MNENMLLILLSSIVLISATDQPPRSVNLALETSFLFQKKNINENVSFIKNVKDFLDKLYAILAPREKETGHFRSQNLENERRFGFFELIKNVGNQFVNLTSNTLGDAFKVVHFEIQNVVDKGKTQVPNVLPPREIRKYLQHSASQLTKAKPEDLKTKIHNIMAENNPALSEFAERMNNYYTEDDIKKLNKTMNKFIKYLKKKMDTSKVVKELLEIAIFKKYESLNETLKASLLEDLKILKKIISANSGLKSKAENEKSDSKGDPEVADLSLSERIVDTKEDFQPMEMDTRRKLKMKCTTEKRKPSGQNEVIVENFEVIVDKDP